MTDSQPQPTPAVDADAWERLLQENYGRYDTCKETYSFYDQLKDGKIHSSVVDMFKENRERQTFDYVMQAREKYRKLDKATLSIWDVLDQLDNLEFDKNTVQLQQKVHAFQMAEAMRREGMPRWMILTGLIHDLGKYLYVLGEKQWTVIGDTFPVGCKHCESVLFSQFFDKNPDSNHPVYGTDHGIYEPHCGLANVYMSFGHDEYMYMVCKYYLPPEALFIIRYHSFYSCHQEGAYAWLLSQQDMQMMKWVKTFLRYDLYSYSEELPDLDSIKPYYKELISEYFPDKIRW
ncbi:hypothetical protein O0I10_007896 [Lichtheimia ornata]|uniref:Inositol oxygenase n=1 Tax=Lichtheimia ornata TaxID=688661 RepID=A0AAD7XZU2_9FUNG|nr:uncharacterized protein O0I10_007896 [Lichtheimia ornata]KAJ8656332.1 hypothetical protein O0I10_007896 [Lichtheimia ornata]